MKKKRKLTIYYILMKVKKRNQKIYQIIKKVFYAKIMQKKMK